MMENPVFAFCAGFASSAGASEKPPSAGILIVIAATSIMRVVGG